MPLASLLSPTPSDRQAGLLAGMRIRKKLIVLHTCFSVGLAIILLVALRPAISEVIRQAEAHEAQLILSIVLKTGAPGDNPTGHTFSDDVRIQRGLPAEFALDAELAKRVEQGEPGVQLANADGTLTLVSLDQRTGEWVGVTVVLQGARAAVLRLYLLFTIALLAAYALVAAALEIFVLPQTVYRPIRAILDADAAVQEGRRADEIIPASQVPADELGSIMRSRNRSIESIRRHESDLAQALGKLEEVALDLRKKNHLLEMARQNLADADRLASLGMMSAGIAHELNTPLAVLKGMVEKLNSALRSENPLERAFSPDEAALMLRVVGRLERLSESLLDFARVRPPVSRPTRLAPLIDEAWTLVRLDRGARQVSLANSVADDLEAPCDPDRIVQVLVNILRNAVDAGDAARNPGTIRTLSRIDVRGDAFDRDGTRWASIIISDDGPGIRREILDRLFQPFVSTRLDAKGTGLGLAVAEGIVREHRGLLVARNKGDGGSGAIFEVVLPQSGPPRSGESAVPSTSSFSQDASA